MTTQAQASSAMDAHVASTTEESTAAENGSWMTTPIRLRLAVLRDARHRMAGQAEEFAAAISPALERTTADTLVSELLPLLDACKFLERNAEHLLAPRRLGRGGRPAWMRGVSTEVRRAAWGRVLVIAPSNFPLFLAGAQTLQALAAGNCVTWKPGRGGQRVAHIVQAALIASGLPVEALRVTGESVAAGEAELARRPDFVVFTGSAANGKRVLETLAETATPCILELSGCDAVVVLAGANLRSAASALRFGLRLNGGAVCMRPQRLIAAAKTISALRALLTEPEIDALRWVAAETEAEMQRAVADDAHGLTVSVFCGDAETASFERLASCATAGAVLRNDVIAPTTDPRAPFGGRGASGFGVTRGAEGLLAMTTPKVVYRRGSAGVPQHFENTTGAHAPFFAAWIGAVHSGSWSDRVRAVGALVKSARALKETGKR